MPPRSSQRKRSGAVFALVVMAVAGVLCMPGRAADLRVHQTRYYVLHTDLDERHVLEAKLRLGLMAEEYNRRLQGLAGTVRDRLPFYLFKNMKDYLAAGGPPGSAGVFDGTKLMALASEKYPAEMWATVQHEGFHQFLLAAVGLGIPIWANEGLAEYFALGQFTGDQFLTGLIPPARLAVVKEKIRKGSFKPLVDMVRLKHAVWNVEMDGSNYDQAWSMVHFLAHADDGRYQQPFLAFLREVSRRMEPERAWRQQFGDDFGAFERRWSEWWLEQPENPTADLYGEVVLSTLTSFYARARAMKQSFASADEFFEQAKEAKLQAHPEDWLPPWLLEQALKAAPHVGTWSLTGPKNRQILVLTLPSGRVLEGHFTIKGERVTGVEIRQGRRSRR